MNSLRTCLVGALLLGSASTQAAALAIDEATYPGAGGDYNNLLNPPQPMAVMFGGLAGIGVVSRKLRRS